MSKRSKRNFDKSFKQQAVQLALTSNQPITKTAHDLGIRESTLYSWVEKAKAKKEPENSAQIIDISKVHEELLKLRKENQRLKDTCEILKKATAYFANDSKHDTRS
jgi:transposase